jgi:hypothetical protein
MSLYCSVYTGYTLALQYGTVQITRVASSPFSGLGVVPSSVFRHPSRPCESALFAFWLAFWTGERVRVACVMPALRVARCLLFLFIYIYFPFFLHDHHADGGVDVESTIPGDEGWRLEWGMGDGKTDMHMARLR